MNDNYARRISEAEVIVASLALARHAGWSVRRNPPTAPSPHVWSYLHLVEPNLLFVPTIDAGRADRFLVARAMRQARCNALMIAARKTSAGARQMIALIAFWTGRGVEWFGPHLPWLGEDDALWLVPDARMLACSHPTSLHSVSTPSSLLPVRIPTPILPSVFAASPPPARSLTRGASNDPDVAFLAQAIATCEPRTGPQFD